MADSNPARTLLVLTAALLLGICAPLAVAQEAAPPAQTHAGPTLFTDHVPGPSEWSFSVTPQGVVNGYQPPSGQWPWIASLHVRGASVCGGTLIAPDVVLTAAHCVTKVLTRIKLPASIYRVIFGREDLGLPTGEVIRVRSVVVHPRWTGSPVRGHDVALMRLRRPATPTPALIGNPRSWGTTATAMGWGLTAERGNPSRQLLAVDLPLVEDAVCQAVHGVQFNSTTMMCAGGNVQDTCAGDSGGPLMIPGGPRGWLLIGATSWGEGCARQGFPGVYAWVAGPTLSRWIFRNAA